MDTLKLMRRFCRGSWGPSLETIRGEGFDGVLVETRWWGRKKREERWAKGGREGNDGERKPEEGRRKEGKKKDGGIRREEWGEMEEKMKERKGGEQEGKEDEKEEDGRGEDAGGEEGGARGHHRGLSSIRTWSRSG